MSAAPTIVNRAGWGARPARGRTTLNATWGTTGHYNGPAMWYGKPPEQWNHGSCPTKVRAIQNFHMDSRKWQDGAYSYCVCPHGMTYEMRGLGVRTGANGTNVGNATSYAVMLLVGENEPIPEAMAAEFSRLVDFLRHAGRAGPNLGPHHRWKSTACPGKAGDQLINRYNSGWRPDQFVAPAEPESAPFVGDLLPGQSVTSGNGATTFIHQTDGNVVVYRHGIATWATMTHGKRTGVLSMQRDGNLVLYGPQGAIWATATHSYTGAMLRVQNDGNVVIYATGGRPVWSSWGNIPRVERPLIKRGARGEDVRYAQRRLIAHGLGGMLAPYGADGVFGGGTEVAVRMFQTTHRLARDGVIGPATWRALG